MAQNLQLDPLKRDYVFEAGSPIPSDRVLEAAYFALRIPQGNWLYGDQDQGSYLYLLNNIKRVSTIEQLYASFSNEAIKRQLIDRGLASQVQTKNLSATRTITRNDTAVVPVAQQTSSLFGFVGV